MNAIRTNNSEYFYKKYKKVNLHHRAASTGATPLLMAAQFDRRDIVAKLIRSGAVPTTDNDGNNILHAAIVSRDYPLIDYAIKHRVNPYALNNAGTSPIMLAEEDLIAENKLWHYEDELIAEQAELEFYAIKEYYEGVPCSSSKRKNEFDEPEHKRSAHEDDAATDFSEKRPFIFRFKRLT